MHFKKSRYVYEKTGQDCFADGSGLEIEALKDKSGVDLVKYASEQSGSEDDMDNVHDEQKDEPNREPN